MKKMGKAYSTMSHGPGPVKGAGYVTTGGPGKAAMRVKPHMAGAKFSVGSKSTPSGMKIQRSGE